jgi:hypothetical protein
MDTHDQYLLLCLLSLLLQLLRQQLDITGRQLVASWQTVWQLKYQ